MLGAGREWQVKRSTLEKEADRVHKARSGGAIVGTNMNPTSSRSLQRPTVVWSSYEVFPNTTIDEISDQGGY